MKQVEGRCIIHWKNSNRDVAGIRHVAAARVRDLLGASTVEENHLPFSFAVFFSDLGECEVSCADIDRGSDCENIGVALGNGEDERKLLVFLWEAVRSV